MNKKFKKFDIWFALFMCIFWFLKLFISKPNLNSTDVVHFVILSVIFGIIAGFIYGILMFYIVRLLKNKKLKQ